MQNIANKDPGNFTDRLRTRFKGILDPLGRFLIQLGLTPNMVTLLGFLGTFLGSIFLATGHITIGGLVILAFAPLDALDGTMARLSGKTSTFGAFLDSVTDRYSELTIFGALLIYFTQQQNLPGIILAYLAAAGSVLVSYIRARGQSIGYDTKVGILTRVERFIVLVPCLILNIPMVAVGVIALFANITAIQRIRDVNRKVKIEN